MSISAGEVLQSSDIAALKSRVNAEMARRKYQGSLAAYNTAFSVSANSGYLAKIAHFNETVGNINRIKATGVTASQGDIIYSINAAITRLATNEQTSIQANSTDCASSCTGMCYTTCSGSCRGCTGCTGSCTGCTGCSGSCKGCTSCSGTCKGCTNCTGGCGGCTSCSGGCKGCTSCSGGCKGCTGCSGGCDGCGNSCSDDCNSWCTSHKGSCSFAWGQRPNG